MMLDGKAIRQAIQRFNADRPGSWPWPDNWDGVCPACDAEAFGQCPGDLGRWECLGTMHGVYAGTVGVPYSDPRLRAVWSYRGDSLDLAAHAARLTPLALLQREGYLPRAWQSPEAEA